MNKTCNSVLNDNDNLLTQPDNSDPASFCTGMTHLQENYAPEGIVNYPQLLQPRLQPGVYMILCLVNNYRYYGETSNISKRIAGHKRDLRRKKHANESLQTDWNAFGEENFEFSVLFIGQEWSVKETRLEKETKLILDHPNKVYNTYAAMTDRVQELNAFYGKKHSESTKALIGALQRNVPKDNLGRAISITGKKYPSLAEASRQTGHSRKLIRKRVNESEYKDWFALSEKPNDYPNGSRGNASPEKTSV